VKLHLLCRDIQQISINTGSVDRIAITRASLALGDRVAQFNNTIKVNYYSGLFVFFELLDLAVDHGKAFVVIEYVGSTKKRTVDNLNKTKILFDEIVNYLRIEIFLIYNFVV